MGYTLLCAQMFDSNDVNMDAITFPPNLPSFFPPHFFPQLAGKGSKADEAYSIQWNNTENGTGWTPSIWLSECSSIDDLVTKTHSSDIAFTGLYIAASKNRLLFMTELLFSGILLI